MWEVAQSANRLRASPIQKTTNSVAEATALIEKIKLAQEGDQHAFSVFIGVFFGTMFTALCYSVPKTKNEAEDLTH